MISVFKPILVTTWLISHGRILGVSETDENSCAKGRRLSTLEQSHARPWWLQWQVRRQRTLGGLRTVYSLTYCTDLILYMQGLWSMCCLHDFSLSFFQFLFGLNHLEPKLHVSRLYQYHHALFRLDSAVSLRQNRPFAFGCYGRKG